MISYFRLALYIRKRRRVSIYLLQARRLRRVEIIHAVPDRLQNPVVKSSEMNIRSHNGKPSHTYEAKGVTPIPPPTSSTVSYFKKSSLALPNGPSTIILGRTRLTGGGTTWGTETSAPFSPLRGFLSRSHPSALASAPVKSPTTRM